MADPIKLLLVDDYPVVLSGLVAMFKNHPDLEVVGIANNGKKAASLALALHPDVVLMNLVMPEMDGIETTQLIKKDAPGTKVIIFSGLNTYDAVTSALNAGAVGYLLKDAAEPELVQAVRQVAQGEVSLHPAVLRHVLKQMRSSEEEEGLLKRLTERELSVLKMMTKGCTNQEIARQMTVSAATVHSHVSHILSKLEVSSRTQAVIYAMRAGIVVTPDE